MICRGRPNGITIVGSTDRHHNDSIIVHGRSDLNKITKSWTAPTAGYLPIKINFRVNHVVRSFRRGLQIYPHGAKHNANCVKPKCRVFFPFFTIFFFRDGRFWRLFYTFVLFSFVTDKRAFISRGAHNAYRYTVIYRIHCCCFARRCTVESLPPRDKILIIVAL